MSEGLDHLYGGLLGMEMMAVNVMGVIYASGTVESVHVKPIGGGEDCYYAKLSDGKVAPLKDLIHAKPMVPVSQLKGGAV